MSSLKQLAIRGTIWTIASYGASQILRFGGNLILTRLLYPKLFGLLALVNIFIIGLHLFSDIGIGPSIIHNKRGDDSTFLNTAWTLQIIRSFVIWFCCILLTWPTAKFYGEPQLLWLIPVVGLNTIISGFNSTALFTLNRHMAFGKLAIFQLAVQASTIIVIIFWATLSPSIWALVGGNFVGAVVQLVFSYRLVPEQSNGFAWDRNVLNELIHFGRWIFISTIGTFLADQIDRIILGKLLSLELLGVYGIAATFAVEMPRGIIIAIADKVIFPALSKVADLPRETLRAKIMHNRKRLLLGLALGLALLIGFGDILISVLYDKRYRQAAWMVPILALGLWPNIMVNIQARSLYAIGKPSYVAAGNFLKFIFMLIGIPIGYYLNGILGAVIIVALNDLPFYGAVIYGLWQEGLADVVQDIKDTLIFLALVIIALTCRYFLGYGLPINTLHLAVT